MSIISIKIYIFIQKNTYICMYCCLVRFFAKGMFENRIQEKNPYRKLETDIMRSLYNVKVRTRIAYLSRNK